MAEKEQQSPYPIAPSNGDARSTDTEATTAHAATREPRNKKKRTKCMLFIVLFVVLQTGIITLFALTVMKVRTPKFRVGEATLTTLNAEAPATPALGARLNVEFSVKNANFGRYKYGNTTVVFMYRGTPVGQAVVPSSRAGWRSTRKFNVEVDLNMGNRQRDSELSRDLEAGIVLITSEAKLRGRVELIFVVKKNKATDMNCSMEIVRETQQIRNINCR